MVQSAVEGFRLQESFQRQVHAVPPVIFWIGRNVDAFGAGIGPPQLPIHAKQILKLENAPHGG